MTNCSTAPTATTPQSAKRARQLNSYYRALGEGSYEEYTPPMVDAQSGSYLTIALEELAAGKIRYRYRS